MRMLYTAFDMLAVEKEDREKDRENTLAERVPPLKLSGLSVQELQVRPLPDFTHRSLHL